MPGTRSDPSSTLALFLHPRRYPPRETALPSQPTLDASIPPLAWISWPDLGGDNPYNRTNSDAQVRQYRAAYYAAVSWADRAAGEVLQELEALQLVASTLVVMHADHGWHCIAARSLTPRARTPPPPQPRRRTPPHHPCPPFGLGTAVGEYNMWEKRTLWENAARVPLVLRAPWLPRSAGARVASPVELVDLYRTVCDALGAGLPAGDDHPVEGDSLMPLLRAAGGGDGGGGGGGGGGDGGGAVGAGWAKEVALTTYPRCPKPGKPDWQDNDCIHTVERSSFGFMGYSMLYRRADGGATYRYTEWLAWDGAALRPLLGRGALKAVELYNHTDPLPSGASGFDEYENVNLAPRADPQLLQMLSARLRKEFALE